MEIPYGKHNIDEKDIEAVIQTLNSNFLTQGPKIKEFEKKFANYVDSKYAIAVSNATAGLHLSVLSLGLQKGDKVITSPITFASTANCIRHAGGEVWFADIEPETYLISIQKTIELIESRPKGFFKGIIAVDFAGHPVNLEKLKKVAKKNNLWIIEDACHAPGAYFINSQNEKIKCGSAIYSDCSVFSFHPVKHIACGEGGMITTNNKLLYEKIKLLRTHGITKDNVLNPDGAWYYEMIDLGYNYRFTEIQAALGINQLKKNISGVKIRNKIAIKYNNAFKGKVKYQKQNSKSYNAYHLYVIEANNRNQLYDQLKKNKIYSQIHYIPIHKLEYYKKIGYSSAELGNAEDYYNKCLSLPIYPTLSKNEQDYVIQNVLKYVK